MPENESLVYEIKLDIKSLLEGYNKLESATEQIKEIMDFSDLRAGLKQYRRIINETVTQINESLNRINLKNLSDNIAAIKTGMERMSSSISEYIKQVGKDTDTLNHQRLDKIDSQFDELKKSIEKFSQVSKGQLADAFKSKAMQDAAKGLKDYAKAMKDIQSLDMVKLFGGKNNAGKDIEGAFTKLAGIDFSDSIRQIKELVGAFRGLGSVQKYVDAIIKSTENMSEAFKQDDQEKALSKYDRLTEGIKKLNDAVGAARAHKLDANTANAVDMQSFDSMLESIQTVSDAFQVFAQKRRQTLKQEDVVNGTNPFLSIVDSLDKVNRNMNIVAQTIVNSSRIMTTAIQSLSRADLSQLINQYDSLNKAGKGVKTTAQMMKEKAPLLRITDMSGETKQGFEEMSTAIRNNFVTNIQQMVQSSSGAMNQIVAQTQKTISDLSKAFSTETGENNFKKLNTTLGRVSMIMDEIQGKSENVRKALMNLNAVNITSGGVASFQTLAQSINQVMIAVQKYSDTISKINNGGLRVVSIIEQTDKLKDTALRFGELQELLDKNKNTQVMQRYGSVSQSYNQLITSVRNLQHEMSVGTEVSMNSIVDKAKKIREAVDKIQSSKGFKSNNALTGSQEAINQLGNALNDIIGKYDQYSVIANKIREEQIDTDASGVTRLADEYNKVVDSIENVKTVMMTLHEFSGDKDMANSFAGLSASMDELSKNLRMIIALFASVDENGKKQVVSLGNAIRNIGSAAAQTADTVQQAVTQSTSQVAQQAQQLDTVVQSTVKAPRQSIDQLKSAIAGVLDGKIDASNFEKIIEQVITLMKNAQDGAKLLPQSINKAFASVDMTKLQSIYSQVKTAFESDQKTGDATAGGVYDRYRQQIQKIQNQFALLKAVFESSSIEIPDLYQKMFDGLNQANGLGDTTVAEEFSAFTQFCQSLAQVITKTKTDVSVDAKAIRDQITQITGKKIYVDESDFQNIIIPIQQLVSKYIQVGEQSTKAGVKAKKANDQAAASASKAKASVDALTSSQKKSADQKMLSTPAVTLTGDQLAGITSAINACTKAVNDFGNVFAKVFLNQTVDGLLNMKTATNTVMGQLAGLKKLVDGVGQKGTDAQLMGGIVPDEKQVQSLQSTLVKIGDLITKIFTTYNNLSSIPSTVFSDNAGQVSTQVFESHLRDIKTKSDEAGDSFKNLKVDLQGLQPFMSSINEQMKQLTGLFSLDYFPENMGINSFGQLFANIDSDISTAVQGSVAKLAQGIKKIYEQFGQMQGYIFQVVRNISEQFNHLLGDDVDAFGNRFDTLLQSGQDGSNIIKKANAFQQFGQIFRSVSSSSTELIRSINQIGDAIQDLKDKGMDGSFIQFDASKIDAFNATATFTQEQIDKISSSLSGLNISVSDESISHITDSIGRLNQSLHQITDILKTGSSAFEPFIRDIGEMLNKLDTTVLNQSLSDTKQVLEGIRGILGQIKQMSGENTSLINSDDFVKLDGKITQVIDHLMMIVKSINISASSVVDAIGKIKTSAKDAKDAVDSVSDAEKQMRSSVSAATKQVDDQYIAGITSDINRMKEALKDLNSMKGPKSFDESMFDTSVQRFEKAYAAVQKLMNAKPKQDWSKAQILAFGQLETLFDRYMSQWNRLNQIRIDGAEASAKAEAAVTQNAIGVDMSATQKHYDELLKKEFDYQKELVKVRGKINSGNLTNDGNVKAKAEQARLLGQISGIQAEIKTYEDAGINNQDLKNKLQEKMNRLLAQQSMQSKSNLGIGDKLLSQLSSMLRMYIGIHALRRMWSEAKKYAQEYYDAINEIRMVTGMTEEQADALVDKYQELAVELKASSTEIAKAAVTYYRQGLSTEDVDQRLIATTKYAKIAGIEFNTAADIMTAALNTLGKESNMTAEQVSDVFIALGNAAGSSAQEIGTAMQKASASAEAAGVSFEWLGSYIATISEATRQNAESIGTALTTLMSRLHAIRSSGYNSEDDFGVNDVAKALKNINISLFDTLTGEWREIPVIFEEIAAKWSTLDDRTRSYIATVMAGTRQQNYFLALMNDMSKGATEGSRAFELYAKALDAAGTTTESYAVYTESVKSAQDELTANLEKLYSTIVNDDFLKGMYNIFSGLVSGFTEATKASNKLNIAIPAVAAGVLVLVSAVRKLMTLNPVTAIIAAVSVLGQLAFSIGAVNKAAKEETVKKMQVDYGALSKQLEESTTDVKSMVAEYEKLAKQYKKLSPSSQEALRLNQEMESVITKLVTKYPQYADAISAAAENNADYEGTISAVNQKLEEQLALLEQVNQKKIREDFMYGDTNEGSLAYNYNAAVAEKNNAASRNGSLLNLYNAGLFDKTFYGIEGEYENLYRDFIGMVPQATEQIIKRVQKLANNYGKSTYKKNSNMRAIEQSLEDLGYNLSSQKVFGDADVNALRNMINGGDIQAYDAQIKLASNALAERVYEIIPNELKNAYTNAQAAAVKDAISDAIINGFGSGVSGFSGVGEWLAQWIMTDMVEATAKGAAMGVDRNTIKAMFENAFGEQLEDDLVDMLMDAGVNSDIFGRALTSAKANKYDFDLSDMDSFAREIKIMADQVQAAMYMLYSSFSSDFTDEQMDNAFDFMDVINDAVSEMGYSPEQMAQVWRKLMGIDYDSLASIAESSDIKSALQKYLQGALDEVVKTWGDILDGYINNSSISTENKIGFANKLLDDLTSTGGLNDFLTAYRTIAGKTNKNNIQGLLGVDDDVWSSIVEGTASIDRMTAVIMKARAALELKGNENTYLDGLADAFDKAEYGGANFVRATAPVMEEINKIMQVQRAYDRISKNQAIKNNDQDDYQTLRDYFSIPDDVTNIDYQQLGMNISKQSQKIRESFSWVKEQINTFAELKGVMVDWNRQTETTADDIDKIAVAGDGMLSYLAQLYMMMNRSQTITKNPFENIIKVVTGQTGEIADTVSGKQNALTMLMSNLTKTTWLSFKTEWKKYGSDLHELVGDTFYEAMNDWVYQGIDFNLDDAIKLLEKQFASVDIGQLVEKNSVLEGLDSAYENASKGIANYGAVADEMATKIENFRKAELALQRLLNGGNSMRDKETVRSAFGVGDTFSDWQSLSRDVSTWNSQIATSFMWLRNQIDGISEATIDWDHQTEDTTDDIEHLARTAEGELGYLAQLYTAMLSGNAIRADMFDNLFEDIQNNMADSDEGRRSAAKQLADSLSAESWEAFKLKWSQYKGDLHELVGDDFYIAMENGTLGFANAQLYLNKQIAGFDLSALERQKKIVEGIGDAYTNAAYGGQDFVAAEQNVAQQINKFREMQIAYNRIMSGKAIKNDKQDDYQTVKDYFGNTSDENSMEWFRKLLPNITVENEKIKESFNWVTEQMKSLAMLQGVMLDFDHATETTADDIEQLAVSGKGMLSYLSQLYMAMKQSNGIKVYPFKDMLDLVTGATGEIADTAEGKQNAITMLMANLSQQSWDQFKKYWSEYSKELQPLVGDTFYNAMQNYMHGGKMFDYGKLLIQQFLSLDIDKVKGAGKIVGEIADDISSMIEGQIVTGDSAKSAAESYIEQFYAYLAVAAGDRSSNNLSALGLQGATESMISNMLPMYGQMLTKNLDDFSNTVDYMWGVVSKLTGVQKLGYDQLAVYAGNAENAYASLANYLLMIIDLQQQMSNINPFISLFNTIGADSDVTMQDQVEYLSSIIDMLSSSDESYVQLQQALEILRNNGELEGLAESLGITETELVKIINSTYNAAAASDALNNALNNASKKKNGFANIYKNIEQIRRSADAASKSLNMLSAAQQAESASNSWNAAVDEYYAAIDAINDGGDLADQSLSDLAKALNTTENALRENWSQVPRWMQQYVNDANASLADLQNEYALQITGIGAADFSNLINGCLYVEKNAQEAADELAKLGNFALQTEQIDQVVDVLERQSDGTYKVVKKKLSGSYSLLKPTGSNPLSTGRRTNGGKGGRGGGGGGGGSSKEQSGKSAEELFVERVEESIKRVADRMKQLNTQMNSWDSQGFYTAEIEALGQINEMLSEQDDIYRTKIAEAQAMLPALYQELNRYSFGTEEYDKVLDRVSKIQDAIVEWGQALTENEEELIANRKKIEELHKTIRQLEIDLQEEILQAIEDREEKQQAMLEARIDMENTILDILKQQAEDAEDAILKAIEAQIDALNKEKDAISELLDKRKEEAEEEDKLVKLRKLESKYAMIAVDPTRAKEAKELMQEISDLRQQIAWDSAEDEAAQQQSSLDQQISSLQDYKEYIQQYYEDLLNNPRNFIDQVNAILSMSQEDILAWLQQNSQEYLQSTDSTQASMVTSWTDTLNEMYGVVETHWAEVSDIIAQGQDYVIDFLREHSSEYAQASKLQQEAYLEGWMEMFEKLEAAHKKMQATITDTSGFVSQVQSGVSGSSSGGSGGGSGGSGSSGAINGYKVTVKGLGQTNEFKFSKDELALATSYVNQLKAQHPEYTITGPKKYKRGGYIDYTGLAQVDGSRTQPEYMLNAAQTRMMEKLVSTLEMATIKAPSIPAFDSSLFKASTATSNVFNGGINISVESLDDDADFDALAERVKESIVNAMTHGKSIGF